MPHLAPCLVRRSLLLLSLASAVTLPAQTPVAPASEPTPPAATPQTQPAPQPQPPAPTQPGTAPTRNPDGTFTIRRTARLVILDVVVTDRQGNVVRDLRKSDFHVTESDQPEDILNFEETGAHAPTPT